MSRLQLRDYQQRSIDMLYQWFRDNPTGNPCLVLPTGAGKSLIVAELCRDALQSWPETRILMLTHQAELIAQNAERMLQLWPNAPMGVYSASLRRRQLGHPITFAGIGSVRTRASQIGHVDLVLVDESHRISGRQEGSYRALIGDLTAINPSLRVIGLTATPYRLGQGYVTDGEHALFSELIEPVTTAELIDNGYLCPLRSKATETQYDLTGTRTRAGEYVQRDLQAAVGISLTNREAVEEIVRRAEGRQSWLVFCAGVEHASQVAEYLRDLGVSAEAVTGKTPAAQRREALSDFQAGRITALTNCDVLTTGFDHPGIDLIALMRPTLSPGLYIQMVGRGLRISPAKQSCLVLDFAGNISRHGPVTNVVTPRPPGQGGGPPPAKECPECAELVHTSVMVCPECGHQWESAERRYTLASDDIMGREPLRMELSGWSWKVHTGRRSGSRMLLVTYYGADLSSRPVREYITLGYGGWAGQKAARTMAGIVNHSLSDPSMLRKMVGDDGGPDLDRVVEIMEQHATAPSAIEYQIDGKFHRVIDRMWGIDDIQEAQ